jgi:hypothetical protein
MEPSSDPGIEPVLGDGHYTVVLAGGGHRTLEATRAAPDFWAGPFIVSYLCGPDNERDYRAFSHITAADDGHCTPDVTQGCRRCGRRCHRRFEVGDV